ncbi:hypothetical protein [Fluviicola sp.]|uniref:hypothetical protein n=1 Tax=Fluviicola sp. TaxID=1917219 RepID=UPI0031DB25EF
MEKMLMKSIIATLLAGLVYACAEDEDIHQIIKLNNGIDVDVFIHGDDVGFNDVSYKPELTLTKEDKELKLDLGKSGWPGGYVIFHLFRTSNTDSTQLMVFFNYDSYHNVFKIVNPENLTLVKDTAILNQVQDASQLSGDRIYWGKYEEELIKREKEYDKSVDTIPSDSVQPKLKNYSKRL